eukprot:1585270-Rhodomonas_salina.1
MVPVDHTKVVSDPKLGRCLVASKPLCVGDLVLREPPILTCLVGKGPDEKRTDAGPNGLISTFNSASSSCQAAILDMYHPPVDSSTPHVALRRRDAVWIAHKLGMHVALVLKVLLIRDANSHAFLGKRDVFKEELGDSQTEKLSALFHKGSKAEHSCLPNVEYSSKNGFGLEYRAIRPIAEGEHIRYSYIDGLWSKSQAERQNTLVETKHFICGCIRCAAPDDCRAVMCPACKTTPVFPRCRQDSAPEIGTTVRLQGLLSRPDLNGKNGTVESWVAERQRYLVRILHESLAIKKENLLPADKLACSCGNELMPPGFSSKEDSTRDALLRTEIVLMSGNLHFISPRDLDQLVAQAVHALSPTHHLVVRTFELVNKALASHAVQSDRAVAMGVPSTSLPFGSVESLRCHAAQAGMSAVKTMECIAARCGLGASACTRPHQSVPEATPLVFFCGMDLLSARRERRDKALLCRVAQYLPLMRISYGDDDDDVKTLQDMTLQSEC